MLLDTIQDYWNTRAEGFSLSNLEQLQGGQRDLWRERLLEYAPKGDRLRCLDIGCGPGFLAILLAGEGHDVTGADYSGGMLEHAKKNAAAEGVAIQFRQMDAQRLAFGDNSFDFVVSRNLVWNLEQPGQAYAEWLRVLAPGGRLAVFDGNHNLHHYNPRYADYRSSGAYVDPHKKEHLRGVDPDVINAVAKELPLSKTERPLWDIEWFIQAGINKITTSIHRIPYDSPATGREESIIEGFSICVEKP